MAQGTFSNGTRDITSLVTWSSSATSVASIAMGGLASTHSPGSTTISASFNQSAGVITGSTTLTVTAPALVSIQVSPATPSVAAGNTQQFMAQGTFSNGTTRDITSDVTWSSSTMYVASIASSGLASTYSQGSSTISASFTQPSSTVTGSTTLTVAAPALLSIVVTDKSIVIPGPNSVTNAKTAVGTRHQFYAFGIYSDGGERNITTSVQWTVSVNANVAKFIGSGIVRGLTPGTATITATDPTTSQTQNVTLVVTDATVTAIVVLPRNQTIAPLTRLTFLALGEFSDGTTQDVTVDAHWSSTNTSAATVENQTAISIAGGSTMIQAALGGVTGSAPLSVSSATLVSIALSPSTGGLAIGTRRQLVAIGTFSDGTKQRLISELVWSVTPSDGSIAKVDQNGQVTGVAVGTVTVKVQSGTISNTATLNVQNLSSITTTTRGTLKAQDVKVNPPGAVAAGTSAPFTAIATLDDGTTQDVTSEVTWVSTNPAIATINNGGNTAGWVSGISAGNDPIAAVFSGQYSPVQLAVSNATITNIVITPLTVQSIALDSSKFYKATGTFSDSTTQDLTDLVIWTSSDPTVAAINGPGIAVGVGVGSTMVKATGNIDGITASDDKALIVLAPGATP
jgi:hypothetical protein